MAFTELSRFSLSPALLDTSEKCRLRTVGRRTSGGESLGSIGTRAKENPPQEIPGRAVVVFKIFSPSPR